MDQVRPHQHFPGGNYYQLEHFILLVKRCRLCSEFMGCESMVRDDIPKEPVTPPEIQDA